MKNIVIKLAEDFDIQKNYKLFRIYQNIINPVINKKKYMDFEVDLKTRKINLRIFNPFNDKKPHKIIIFLHGGGWSTGSVASYTNTCYMLAKKLGYILIAPEYRLAPEYPFPAGFDDCYEITKILYNNINELGISWQEIVLMGDSAGGNLAAAISQKALDTKEFNIEAQILLYPALQSDYSNNTKYESVIENGKDYLITQKQLQDFMKHYVKNDELLKNKYVAPLYSNKLFGLPRTLIITCDNDPLRDEGIAYAKKLKWHLVYVKNYNFKGSMHGFLTNILDKKYTAMAINIIKEFL